MTEIEHTKSASPSVWRYVRASRAHVVIDADKDDDDDTEEGYDDGYSGNDDDDEGEEAPAAAAPKAN